MYILLAISSFDEKGVARSTVDNVEMALDSLLAYYEEMGQGTDIYLPLPGSGLSKSGLSRGASLALIEKTVSVSPCYLGGKMTVAIQVEDAREIGLEG